ncbi:MAG TPA: polyphenol oxidase family protein [Acidimicrobiales bacterium]|nr:polyphenol oxidase family protein [Acidimicrobiales bacterium]
MPGPALELRAGARAAHVVATSVEDGDLAIATPPDVLAARRRAVVDLPWTWMKQVHGATVVRVDHPGEGAGREADAAVTAIPGAALAVQVADCAPVALVGSDAVAVAHVGWRGLVAGTLAATVQAMGMGSIRAVVGPCIHAECYEFGAEALAAAEAAAGPRVRSCTSWGTPALDLVAGIGEQLRSCGVEVLASPWDVCTACTPGYWSHRARGDTQRQAMVVWMTEP